MPPGIRQSWFFAVGSLIVLTTALFILTYPLNIAQSDAVGYLRAILANRSNLINASGYSFLMRRLLLLFTSIPPDQSMFVEATDSIIPYFLLKLLIANHAVHLIILALTIRIMSRVFGAFVSLVTAVLWGLSIFFMGIVSISQPEFLQGDLLMLTTAICCLAYEQENIARKLRLYYLASFVFAWVFLIKYNALAFGGFFLLLLIFDPAGIRPKVIGLLGCGAILASVVGLYVWQFHEPKTGTWSLNRDGAWLHVVKLDDLFGPDVLNHSPGIAALRWEALTLAVPQEYGGWAYVSLADSAPQTEKDKYRPKVDAVMAMTEDELRRYIHDNPHPPGYEFIRTPHPLYWYIGLAETDRLGKAMFWEYFRNNPGFMVTRTLLSSVQTAISAFVPAVPTPSKLFGLFTKSKLANGFLLMGSALPVPISGAYWSYNLVLWEPGTRLFSMLETLTMTPWIERLLYLCLVVGLFSPALSREQKRMVCALGLGVIGFVVASHFMFFIRAKEVAAVWPVACLLWAVAVRCCVMMVMARKTAIAKVQAAGPAPENVV